MPDSMKEEMSHAELGKAPTCKRGANCTLWDECGMNAEVLDGPTGLCPTCLSHRAKAELDQLCSTLDGVDQEAWRIVHLALESVYPTLDVMMSGEMRRQERAARNITVPK